MDPIQEGLTLSVIGLVVAFLFMSLFILVIVGLQKIFPEKKEEVTAPAMIPEGSVSVEDSEYAEVAVIAVALTQARSAMASNLGASLEEGRSTWWIANRMNAQQDVGLQKIRRGSA